MARPRQAPTSPPPPTSTASKTTGGDDAGQTLTSQWNAVQRLVPAGPVPVVLGAGALLLAGIIELPMAGALGLGYLALRRWRPHH